MEDQTTEPEQATLCPYCTDLAINNSAAQLKHWHTLALLRSSSIECAICKILLDCFNKRVKEATDRFKQITETTAEHYPLSLDLIDGSNLVAGMCCKYIEAGIALPNKFKYVWRFHIAARESQAPSFMPTAWKTFPTSLETKVSRIRDWLSICESSHPQCGARWPCLPPGRLIDLGADDSSSLKLVSTASMNSEKNNYTTLSYCWGALASLKTTKGTLAAYQNEISRFELPRTFSDAALITREIGLRYLWIDALCIIQDDQDDWAIESSKMADIYHGSKLSVTANDSGSPAGGVFIQGSSPLRERTTGARVFLKFVHLDSGKCTHIHLVPEQRYGSALDGRGWTLQERILSPRTVGVTNSELKWRCGFGTCWESGISYVQGDGTYGNPPVLKESLTMKQNHIWWRWMEDYSRRRLTFPEDRLVATLGLITYYQRIMKDEPVLGLWRSSLHEDLAWMRLTNRSERSPSELPDHNLPSWSSFACDQAISFNPWYGDDKSNEPGESCVDVIELKVLWEGIPYLSQILSSLLVVDGLLREIHLSEVTEVVGCNPPYFNFDEEQVDTVNDPLPWRCAVQWDIEGYRPPRRWHCLLLQRNLTKGYEFGGETFLVLETVTGQTYRRVGIGSLGRTRIPSGLAEQEWEFNSTDRSRITLV